MPPEAVVCDWNGTLIQYRDERPLLESLAIDLLEASLPLHPLRMLRILRARKPLQDLYDTRQRDGGVDFVIEMFRIYNRQVVKGAPLSMIHRATERYAAKPTTQQALDHRLFQAVRQFRLSGKTAGILSAGYLDGIEKILTVSGCRQHFDFCEADRLIQSGGKAIEFELAIYRSKPEHLVRVLGEHDLDLRRTAYVGDSEDDDGCFQIVGHPVVAFLAPDDVKERCARDYNAFVPRDERDLTRYLTLG